MKMKVVISIILCKLSRFVLRKLGKGGTAFPGKLATRICPDLLRYLSRGVKTIVITGTNGKTTCARIIEKLLSDAGPSYFANRSGANLMTGITAEFAVNSSVFGKPKRELALIECDEAASKKVFEYLDPAVILVTNVFRDQLDRFGEITQTLENIKIGTAAAKNAVVCLNADCSLTASIAHDIGNKIVYFGADIKLSDSVSPELSDALYCIRCKTKFEYDYISYAHLGAFRCPNCHYSRPAADIAITGVFEETPDSTLAGLRIYGDNYKALINLPAAYNIYNAAASVAAATALGFTAQAALRAVSTFECGFGRMEKFELGNAAARMILVKNPAGCNQVISYLTGIRDEILLVICLSDRIADGTDISWIWDASFEDLAQMENRLSGAFISGLRAYEMAMRLKYAGVSAEKITVIHDYDKLLAAMSEQERPIYIMPTYTAMLELRDKISAAYGYKDFWE